VSEDPTDPEFWNRRYRTGRTPWDVGRVPAALTRWLARHPGNGAHALIPGCGSGYEIAAFAAAGYAVTAIDLSAAAVALARAVSGPERAGRVVQGDFFEHDFSAAPFDLVFEHSFLCALPPSLWPRVVARTAALLKPGGTLAGFWDYGAKDDGPPFGLARGEPARLFDPYFVAVQDPHASRTFSRTSLGLRERWEERRRRG
jgi:SAM-dependent methyltransferase